jgi:Gene product 88
MLRYIKMGNGKIAKSVGRIDLPTSVCRQQCTRCYARKMLFPNVVAYRQKCLDLANSEDFVDTIDKEIKESWCRAFRFHCAGDFYNQTYIGKCTEVMRRNPEVSFFHWTKNFEVFDFSIMDALHNVNTMNSRTPLGLNYGDEEFITKLKEDHGYTICPDKGQHDICMSSCKLCLTSKKVAFLIH